MSAADTHAFITGLVVSHGVKLRRFLLLRVRNAADVPDILQEIYLRMLRVPNLESIRSPEAYLFTVAQHVVQQHALRQSAAPCSVELSEMLHSAQKLGVPYKRRPTASEKAEEKLRALLAEHPELRERVAPPA